MAKTYCVSVRLRRTKVEYAFVSVPVEGNVMEQHPEKPVTARLSGEKVLEVAKRMGLIRAFFGQKNTRL